MSEKNAIVTTTIYVPKLLDAYAADAKKFKHDVLFVVVGDKKTPAETAGYCAKLQATSGFRVEYFSVERQEEYLLRFPALKAHLPYNSIQRRNVGILFAYQAGCERIATIDDDNFLVTKNYLGSHVLGKKREYPFVRSNTGWVNVCQLLKEKRGRRFYHRGFPVEMRRAEKWNTKKQTGRAVVNAGLWLGDPDVDAMERLYHFAEPTEAVTYTGKENIAISKDAWTPFNSQNTAFLREVIPAYFLSPLIGRYDDIWAAYILKHITNTLGDCITFGAPVVRQERNPHNYWRDLDNERYGHALTMRFVETLASIPLTSKDYQACFAELAKKLPKALEARTDIKDDERAFLKGLTDGMKVWVETFAKL